MSKNDGSKGSHYELPPGATKLGDLIEHRNMNHADGEAFCALYRKGRASHSDELRDARKVLYYARAEVERLERLKLWDDGEKRIDVIGPNGNNGEHYVETQRMCDPEPRRIPLGMDMSDPANWRVGDLVECVNADGWSSFKQGGIYAIKDKLEEGVMIKGEMEGNTLVRRFLTDFRFHSRPSAQQHISDTDGAGVWTVWPGGECPCDELSYVEVMFLDGEKRTGTAGLFYWQHEGGPIDIIRYRLL